MRKVRRCLLLHVPARVRALDRYSIHKRNRRESIRGLFWAVPRLNSARLSFTCQLPLLIMLLDCQLALRSSIRLLCIRQLLRTRARLSLHIRIRWRCMARA